MKPTDKADIISNAPTVRKDGRKPFGLGVMLGMDNPGAYSVNIERYAVLLELSGDTRAGIVAKLRRLADAVDSGVGGVWGENLLTGNELNASDFAEVDEPATEVKYPPDFTPSLTAKRLLNLHVTVSEEADLINYLEKILRA